MLPSQFDVYLVTNSSGKGGAKHPLTTSGRCWFCLFFSHLFQPCTALQETNVLHVLQKKKQWRTTRMTLHHQCSGQTSCTRSKFWFQNLPYNKSDTNHWHTTRQWKWWVIFNFIGNTKSKRKKIKKPCGRTAQSSTGLHYQAHKKHRTELVRGYLAPHFWK